MNLALSVLFWLAATDQVDVIVLGGGNVAVRAKDKGTAAVRYIRTFKHEDDLDFGIDIGLIRKWVTSGQVEKRHVLTSRLSWALEFWEAQPGEEVEQGIVIVPAMPGSKMRRPVPVDGFLELEEATKQGATVVEVFALSPDQVRAAYVRPEDIGG